MKNSILLTDNVVLKENQVFGWYFSNSISETRRWEPFWLNLLSCHSFKNGSISASPDLTVDGNHKEISAHKQITDYMEISRKGEKLFFHLPWRRNPLGLSRMEWTSWLMKTFVGAKRKFLFWLRTQINNGYNGLFTANCLSSVLCPCFSFCNHISSQILLSSY